ncbi:hypothetical protein [Tautonia sociabilis]|uniref:Uncharacterized protein n=1 Tax=Tautonia sociabilis TaxID=2080755 RepID=A0A432MDY2_9BACT|nr:hypothetical protein [Tautonia sociabilis]RUL83311.1 hypothetical protein TsocGM_22440 [Tautonia sociabilis]
MIRRTMIAGLAGLLGLVLCPTGEAQWGWGGWGGGASIQGTRAYGMGNFAAGAGQFNEQTAEARSINANTAMQFNEYIYQCNERNHQEYYASMARQERLDQNARLALQDRHLNAATDADIISGDGPNALLHWLSNPQIPHDLLVQVGEGLTLSSNEVRSLPLESAAQGIVVSIERLAAEDWPDVLSGPAFQSSRDSYAALVEQARVIPRGQDVPDELVDKGIDLLQAMRSVAHSRLRGPNYAQAERYLKAHVGLLQMLRSKKNIREILEKVREVEEVPLVNALNFMHAYCLQFGPADDQQEKVVYLSSLSPKLVQLRSRRMAQAGGGAPPPTQAPAPAPSPAQAAPAGSPPPAAMFDQVPWEQVVSAPAHAP